MMKRRNRTGAARAWVSPGAILRSQRADTLIEVVFALGILSAVLAGSIGIITKAFQEGHTAGERTQLAGEAQQQVEVLRAFRDNHSWTEFLSGSNIGASYRGVLNFTGWTSTGCRAAPTPTTPCFHMQRGQSGPASFEYLPVGNGISGSVNTSFIEISPTIPPGVGNPPNIVDFTITYGFETLGGGASNEGHIKTRLTNLQLAIPTPPPPGSFPPPTPTPSCSGGVSDISLVLDASSSMEERFNNGLTKWSELLAVTKTFFTQANISPAGNHAGIVQFNKTALILSPIVDNQPVLVNALNGYNMTGGTNISQGLIKGRSILLPNGRPQVVLLVTDGLPNGDTIAQAQGNASLLAAAGIRIYTIQISSGGTDPVSAAFLSSLVANGGSYANASNDADLRRILADIAGREGCH